MAQMNKSGKSPEKKRLTKEQAEAKKRLAFTLYTENGWTQKAISELTGISEVSISAWKKDGNWDEDREQLRIGPEMEMRRLRKMLNKHLDELEEKGAFPDSKQGDAIKKVSSSINDLMLKNIITAWHKTEVGKQFISYIQETYGQARAVEELDVWHEWIMATT